MTTTFAPMFCASWMIGQSCKLVVTVLTFHSTMYLEWAKLSGSTPPLGPTVLSQAV
ncbi:MAG: hypothetical protein ABJL72_09900 [Roseobacter sp.]